MSQTVCRYQDRRDEMLVAYLYDDMEIGERAAFAGHLGGCVACQVELADLESVRRDLARWTPPEPARVLAFSSPPVRRRSLWTALGEAPGWAQVAAALLVLALSAAIANLEIRYDRDGFAIRTGWSEVARARPTDTANGQAAAETRQPSQVAPALWQADLATLETTLRAEMQNVSPPGGRGPSASVDEEALLRRVRAMIEVSERNQRNELALRVAEVARDMQAQRTADLQRIQRTFLVLENTTGGAIVRQRQLLNNLAVRVSQQP